MRLLLLRCIAKNYNKKGLVLFLLLCTSVILKSTGVFVLSLLAGSAQCDAHKYSSAGFELTVWTLVRPSRQLPGH